MKFLKKFWNWLLSQTTLDEKIEAKVAINTAIKESADVVKSVKPKKKRNYSKPKGSGASPRLAGSGASPKLVGSGASPKPKGSGASAQSK